MNPWTERWIDASVFTEDLGGTTVPYERIGRFGKDQEWIVWGLGENGANAKLYNGGEDCKIEVQLNQGELDGLYMSYSENGELEKVNIAMVAFLYLTGNPDLIKIANNLYDNDWDVLMGVYVNSGNIIVDWEDEEGDLLPMVDGYIEAGERVGLKLKLPSRRKLKIEIEVGENELWMRFKDWEVRFSRWVNAGMVQDIKSPGAASDFLFGELITIGELLPGDGGFAGELDG